MEDTQFHYKSANFEGPVFLLLELIEKQKLYINSISLAQVCDSFVEYVRSLGSYPKEQISEIIGIISTLLLIKSKSLIPNLIITQEEEKGIESLTAKLQISKIYKDMSKRLGELFGESIYGSQSRRKLRTEFFPPSDLGVVSLFSSYRQTTENFISTHGKAPPRISLTTSKSLEDAITELSTALASRLRTFFRELTHIDMNEKPAVIVNLLAILELNRRGTIFATQKINFGDIELESNETKVPAYK